MGTWLIGAAFQLVGSCLITLAQNLLSLAHKTRSQACTRGKGRPVFKYWQWRAGWLLFVLSNILNFSSYAFTSQALLTALSSVQFVCNVLFSRWLLDERARPRTLLATAIIVAGNVVLVAFASKRDPQFTALELRRLYLSTQYSIYLTVVAVGVPVSYGVAHFGIGRLAKAEKASPGGMWLKLTPIAYSVCSSLVGAQAVLFSTSLSILARKTLAGDNQLASWFTAVLVLGLAACATFWVARLNQGLRLFDATTIIPLLQICWILLTMVSGNLYFQEFNRFSRLQLAMFAVGMALLLLGIWCLAPSSERAQQEAGADCSDWQHPGAQPKGDAVAKLCLLESGRRRSHTDLPPGSTQQQQCSPSSQQALSLPDHLDAAALIRLPAPQLAAALVALGLLPETEEGAWELERALKQRALKQQQQQQHHHQRAMPPAQTKQQGQMLQGGVQTWRNPLLHSRLGEGFHLQTDVHLPSTAEAQPPNWQQQQQLQLPAPACPAAFRARLWVLPAAQPPAGSPLTPPPLHSQRLPPVAMGPALGVASPLGSIAPLCPLAGHAPIPSPATLVGRSFAGAGARFSMLRNPLYEEEAAVGAAAAVGQQAAVAAAAAPPHLLVPASKAIQHPACSVLPCDPAVVRGCRQQGGSPAALVQLERCRERRSSIARLTAAARGAAVSLRHSVLETASLMAGLGESERLQAASVFAMPLMTSDARHAAPAAGTLLSLLQQGKHARPAEGRKQPM